MLIEEIITTAPILDCPLCGYTAQLERRKTEYVQGYGVFCTSCLCNNWEAEQPYETQDEAIEEWNRRSNNELDLRERLDAANEKIKVMMIARYQHDRP